MIKYLKSQQRIKEATLLIAMSLFCFSLSLSLVRFLHSDTKAFLFLNWNLFLAFIPWLISAFFVQNPRFQRSKILVTLLIAAWLLLFPNAPYLLTDLLHLKQRQSIPLWFDLILILSFAWTGLMYGIFSLMDIEVFMERWLQKRQIVFLIIGLLFLCSFGIYLGRYLRWNSWDVIQAPSELILDMMDRVINPVAHSRTWSFTLLMGIFLNFAFWSVKLVANKKTSY